MKQKMKMKIKIIIALIMWVILGATLIFKVNYAASDVLNVSIEVDGSNYSVGDDIEVTVKLNKKVMTSSYYLKYDSNKVSYKTKKAVDKGSLTTKDYPEDNLVRVAYVDIDNSSELGTNEMTFVFTAKENIQGKPEFTLDNTTMTIEGVDDAFKQTAISSVDNQSNIELKTPDSTYQSNSENVSNKVEENKLNEKINQKDSSTSQNNLPQTGGNSTLFLLIGIFSILTMYIVYGFVRIVLKI